MSKEVICRVSPSLAMIKYWGKEDPVNNLPATTSIALNLTDLFTETKVSIIENDKDVVKVDGIIQPCDRFEQFFLNIRNVLNVKQFFLAESKNNFPTSAGLASSSSGFAALAAACVKASEKKLSNKEISSIARLGSASAARAIYGGIVILKAGAYYAEQLYDELYWPELRVIVVKVDSAKKEVSSRKMMENVRTTSPYYKEWVKASEKIAIEALEAIKNKDLNTLGPLINRSYMSMFGTMIGANPPVLYWKPLSVSIIQTCKKLRADGIGAWETMDAGPQVKIICFNNDVKTIKNFIEKEIPNLDMKNDIIITKPGPGLKWIKE